MKTAAPFTPYQKLALALLALTQFTVVLDFMVLSPLGDMLMKTLTISPKQFGLVVSAYAFSAGASGLLVAGFADRFDRKKLLLFFYSGFILGTLLCGLATTYPMLVAARIVTGLFGGVIGSISLAIVADLFTLDQRGRVMGIIQMGFGASQVLGIPISLVLANRWGWEAPFFLVVGLALLIAAGAALRLQPVTKHLALQRDGGSAFHHIGRTLAKAPYRRGFLATALLSVGGFMMMPFGSAFGVNNLHLSPKQLPLLFMASGVGSLVILPLLGRLSDKVNKFRLFAGAALYMTAVIVFYTHLTPQPLAIVIAINILMMAGILGRMVPAMALVTAVPDPADRGAFMSINSSLQQLAGGVAAFVAGLIVVQPTKGAPLEHYDVLGYVVGGVTLLTIFLVYRVYRFLEARKAAAATTSVSSVAAVEGPPVPAEA